MLAILGPILRPFLSLLGPILGPISGPHFELFFGLFFRTLIFQKVAKNHVFCGVFTHNHKPVLAMNGKRVRRGSVVEASGCRRRCCQGPRKHATHTRHKANVWTNAKITKTFCVTKQKFTKRSPLYRHCALVFCIEFLNAN